MISDMETQAKREEVSMTISNDDAMSRAVRAGELVSPERNDELRSWLSGAPMACPVCRENVVEGEDCDEGHFDELGDAVLAALELSDEAAAI
jgi:hypothetical protein